VTAKYGVRRRTRSPLERVRRLIRYKLIIPVYRSPHPPAYTARGVAIGVFWGVTPFMGFQTALMLATWQVLKRVFAKDSSILQALIWAWVNNPVTMLPMYYLFYVTGAWLMGSSHTLAGYDAFVALWDRSQREPTFMAQVTMIAREVGIALTVGCAPFAVAFSWIAYRWAYTITVARRRRIAQTRVSTAIR
jgi:uncharacterized protein